jgi:hypothetical protein
MKIDTQSLRQLIKLDEQATALFQQGRYGDCAVRCVELAPKVPKPLQISKLGIIAIYSHDSAMAAQVLAALESAAKVNPIISVMVSFMGPGNPESSLPNFGDPNVRAALTAPQPVGLGLTPQQAAPLLAAGEQPDTITGQDVESLGGVL